MQNASREVCNLQSPASSSVGLKTSLIERARNCAQTRRSFLGTSDALFRICPKHKKLDRLFKSKSEHSEYPCQAEQSHLKTRRTYVRNNSNSSPDSPANWRATYLALQPGLGILSHWWPWVGGRHPDRSTVTWENLRSVRRAQCDVRIFDEPKKRDGRRYLRKGKVAKPPT